MDGIKDVVCDNNRLIVSDRSHSIRSRFSAGSIPNLEIEIR